MARIARQKDIYASIAANTPFEYLYDKPYEDRKVVRVAGPFTVENLAARHRGSGLAGLRGQDRVPMPDMIIAAAAQRARTVLLHFDRIAAVTGHAMEWVVARGSV